MKERIKELCKKRGVSMAKAESDLGFAKGYFSKLDQSTPNAKKVKMIADYFHVSLEYLMNGETEDAEPYYINDDARELAQFLFENPDYKVLFDASRTVKKEDIQFVKDMIDKLNGR